MIGVIVVIAAIAVTLVVATGGGDDQADGGTTVSDSTSDTADESGSESPTAPTSTAPPADVPDGAIAGDGYYFELPGVGWNDAYDEARSSGIGSTLDTIIVLGSSIELAQSNILVESLSAGSADAPDQLADLWKRNLSGSDGAVPVPIDEITLDGERAIGVEFRDRLNVNDLLIDQVVYLALHDGNQYSVALTMPSEGDSVSADDFAAVLDSWTWTS